MSIRTLLAALCIMLSTAAYAFTVDTPLNNPAQEEQAKQLFGEIRCVVCQGESLHDSQSSLARDMRGFIRTRIQAGDSPEQVKNTLVSRYGDNILLSPPFAGRAFFIWGFPFVILVVGAFLVVSVLRKKSS